MLCLFFISLWCWCCCCCCTIFSNRHLIKYTDVKRVFHGVHWWRCFIKRYRRTFEIRRFDVCVKCDIKMCMQHVDESKEKSAVYQPWNYKLDHCVDIAQEKWQFRLVCVSVCINMFGWSVENHTTISCLYDKFLKKILTYRSS